jgi:hypothetical protein
MDHDPKLTELINSLRSGCSEALGGKTGEAAALVLVSVQAADILRLCDAAEGKPAKPPAKPSDKPGSEKPSS